MTQKTSHFPRLAWEKCAQIEIAFQQWVHAKDETANIQRKNRNNLQSR